MIPTIDMPRVEEHHERDDWSIRSALRDHGRLF
jgi:hypothetical protein